MSTRSSLPMLRTSERRDFKRCPQRWWWGWREGLKQSGPPNDKLWFGTGWHEVMAHWYQPGKKRGAKPLQVWRDYVKEEMVRIRVNLTGVDEYKQEVYVDAAKLGEEMIGNYIDHFGREEWMHVIQPEKPFEVVIKDADGNSRVLFCGTYDGIYRDERSNQIWLLEHKTAKAIFTGHLTLDNQAGGYLLVAARELRNAKLIGAREQVTGIMYNFARKSPKDDRPVNADGLATNKPTKDHYVMTLSQTPRVVMGIDALSKMTLPKLTELAELNGIPVLGEVSKNQPAKLFQREPVRRTGRERNGILAGIQAEVEHMDAMRTGSLPLYKNPTRDCSWDCNFYDMCVMHETGGEGWKTMRDTMYNVQDPYADHRKSAAGDE